MHRPAHLPAGAGRWYPPIPQGEPGRNRSDSLPVVAERWDSTL